jgi:hypothetical protein
MYLQSVTLQTSSTKFATPDLLARAVLQLWPWLRSALSSPTPSSRPGFGVIGDVAGEIAPIKGHGGGRGGHRPYDLIAKAEATSLDELGRLVIQRIQSAKGVSRTLTCPVLHSNARIGGWQFMARRLRAMGVEPNVESARKAPAPPR